MGWADIKSQARQAVHDTFALPAIFYPYTGYEATVEDDLVKARLHDKSKAVGDLAGTNLSYAEHMERPTRLIFDVAETADLDLERSNFVVMYDYYGNERGFLFDTIHPVDGGKVTVDVTPMLPSDIAGLLLPDGVLATGNDDR